MSIKTLIPTVILVILIPAFIFLITQTNNSQSTIVSPLGQQESIIQRVLEIFMPKPQLTKAVEDNLTGVSGTYAVVIRNLKNGQTYALNENRQFLSASLYKLWVMAVAFQDIKDGILNENDTLTMTRSQLDQIQEIEPDSNQYYDVSFSVLDALQAMITVSDNDSAILLYTRLGEDNISNFLVKNGLNGSSFESEPKTTAKDIADFYEKLYKGAIVDRVYSDKMLALLKMQILNDRLSKYLPPDVKVAHKTGELDNFKHDAGIVFARNGDYIIVVLSETSDSESAAETTAKLSKAVYDLFTKKS